MRGRLAREGVSTSMTVVEMPIVWDVWLGGTKKKKTEPSGYEDLQWGQYFPFFWLFL